MAGGRESKHASRMWLLRFINVYPPFLGAGIRVRRSGPEKRGFDVRMRLTWLNRNVLGSHFGGSLYAMCDPFLALMLIERLGDSYVVWDKAAAISFLRPGRGTVRASFDIAPERVEEIRRAADADGITEPGFVVRVVDGRGETVAEIDKTLYVRRRRGDAGAGEPASRGQGGEG